MSVRTIVGFSHDYAHRISDSSGDFFAFLGTP